MGCFNSVYIGCPHCGGRHEHQSKAGSCLMRRHNIGRAALQDVADAAARPLTCEHCGKQFKVLAKVRILNVVTYSLEDEEDDDT